LDCLGVCFLCSDEEAYGFALTSLALTASTGGRVRAQTKSGGFLPTEAHLIGAGTLCCLRVLVPLVRWRQFGRQGNSLL